MRLQGRENQLLLATKPPVRARNPLNPPEFLFAWPSPVLKRLIYGATVNPLLDGNGSPPGSSLRACYAMSGTGIAYAAIPA
eukprot:3941018-Rhodomonas_salina.4